jgi:hypothetical protein
LDPNFEAKRLSDTFVSLVYGFHSAAAPFLFATEGGYGE